MAFVEDFYYGNHEPQESSELGINDETTQNFTVPKDTLTKGKTYTLTVTAESAYHKISEEKTVSFTVR